LTAPSTRHILPVEGGAAVHRLRVYVDNSVVSGTQDEEFAEDSRRFFEMVHEGAYTVLISEVVLRELERAPEGARRAFADLPRDGVEEVPVDKEVEELARAYVDAGVLGRRRIADAIHVAAATVARADLVLSWNFKHPVNLGRIRGFGAVNALNGYPQVEIGSPLEVAYADEDEEDV
jgi:predicted nucleic acid-binding protein